MPLAELLNNYLPFIYISARVTGLFIMAPVYGAAVIPTRVKGVLVIAISILLQFGLKVGGDVADSGVEMMLIIIIREFLAGLGMGMIVAMTFHSLGLAGAILAPQMGFAMSEMVDPQNQTSASVLSNFFYLLALAFFVAIDGHVLLIKGLAESYRLLPLGEWAVGDNFIEFIMKSAAGMFVIAFTISLPMLAVVLFVNAGMSMMARAVPQMNIFVVGFIIMIGAGLVSMALFLPYYSGYLTAQLMDAMEQMLWLLKTI